MNRNLGLAHLSALHLSPPELIDAAAAAGFTSVGIRVHPATQNERPYPVSAGSPMSKKTLGRMEATGLTVRDVEAFTLDGIRSKEQWIPALESGAALEAEILNVICGDPDSGRLKDALSALVEDAKAYKIRPSVEPISYQALDSVTAAGALVEQTGCGIMLDVLHFVRAGGRVAELRDLPPNAVAVIQLCDGPASTPSLPTPDLMPLGQDVNGSARQIESRAKRLAPGRGDFPLTEILRALPDAPISVEVPDVWSADAEGTDVHLRRIYTAAESLLDSLHMTETEPTS
ncbi:sugar phosphate isomerase/epimerase [Citricoccus sp. NPDC079358]|uniref:sugar phosphate isomerase/epimerase family protein n=1 Tax=unclassified Citricoccus TaxID=2632435 RepID=UPI0012EF8DC0|nr:sugar phosphate isomerase/epimerase [Citricoccus sp. K5]VXB88800.1 Xylose isomerase [Citricoccus sp. K5]